MGERPEVTRAIVLLQSRQHEARDGIVKVDLDEEKSFVVAKTDVVTRLIFLDELAFQQKRLRFAAHDVGVKIMNRLDQRVELEVPAHPPRRMEISGDTLAQITRLADVNDRAKA